MMDFRAELESICASVEGSIAATLMGGDGIPVETFEASPLDANGEYVDVASLLVEYSNVLTQVRQSAQSLSAGDLRELSIRSDHLTTIIRPLNEDYFLALALRPTGNYGKGRYLLRINGPKLVREL